MRQLLSLLGSKKLLGLDIGTSSIKMAELDVSKNAATLVRFGYTPIIQGAVSGGEINDVPTVSESIRTLFTEGGFKRKSSNTGMFGTSVITKKINMPRMEAKMVGEQIRWEAEQYIPFDLNEINLDYHFIQNSQTVTATENMDVLLIAAKQEFIFKYMETVQSAGLNPSIVDVAGFALANCFEFNYGVMEDEVVALLNIGAGVTNFVVVERGEVIFCRDIPVGGLTYTSDISKEMGISFDEAEVLKLSAAQGQEVPPEVGNAIISTNEIVCEEINNSFEFYAATSSGLSISKFYASGGSIYLPNLLDQISNTVGVPYEVIDPLKNVTYNKKAFSDEYIESIKPFAAIVIGLALRKEGDSD